MKFKKGHALNKYRLRDKKGRYIKMDFTKFHYLSTMGIQLFKDL